MPSKALLLTLLAIPFFCVASFADSDDYYEDYFLEGRLPGRSATPRHEFKLGVEWYWAKYEEEDFMEQDGLLFGYNAQYTFRPQPEDAIHWSVLSAYRLQGQYATGEFDYSSNGTGTMDDKNNHTFEIRGVVIKDFTLGSAVVSPYGGFGHRYLLDEAEGRFTTTGHFGYDRRSRYYYFPIGVDIFADVSEQWNVNVNLEYDIFLMGKQTSYLGWVPGFEDISDDQKHGFGLRTSLRLSREWERLALAIEPFFRYWNIDDSEITCDSFGSCGLEPENKTTESGIKLSVQF